MSRESWHGAEAYEAFVGRLSRRVAPHVVDSLGVAADRRWLDVGCGTGALTASILERARPVSIIGIDPSPAFLGAARTAITDRRATFVEGSALELPIPDATVDAAVAGLVLNFVGDVPAALAELRRALVRDGVAAAYVWDYAERMEPIRWFVDAAKAVGAVGAAEADEGARFPLCRPGPLGDAFSAAGFRDVAVEAVEVPADYRNFDAFWTPFLSGVGAAPRFLVELDEETQVRIRERLRTTLPTAPDGSIGLVARAWAVRGRS